MRRWWMVIAVVLVASVAAVWIETAAMAVWGELRFGFWEKLPSPPYPRWPGGEEGRWPVQPQTARVARGALIDGDGFGAHVRSQGPVPFDTDQYELFRLQVGWPMRCGTLEVQIEKHAQRRTGDMVKVNDPPSIWRNGVAVPQSFVGPSAMWSDLYLRRIPIRPIWPGFAVNVLLNACVIGPLMLVPGWVVRARRRCRGACPACGYAMAGLAAGAKCPECGKAE